MGRVAALALGAALGAGLVAGCSDGATQRIDTSSGDVPAGCEAGWTAYPGPSEECAAFWREHPELAPSAMPSGSASGRPASDPPDRSESPDPSPTSRPSPPPSAATASPATRRSATPVASASAGRGSASPASTVRPSPSPTSRPQPTGQLVITEADSGETFTITMSTADALLRLGDGWIWSQPEREGSSVELAQRQFIQDPGYAEWEIRPVARGTTVIRSTGSLACHSAEPPCAAPNRLFEVTIVVR